LNGNFLYLEYVTSLTYVSPLRLTDEEKLSPLVFWKNHADVYPNLAMLARVYLTPSAIVSNGGRVIFSHRDNQERGQIVNRSRQTQ